MLNLIGRQINCKFLKVKGIRCAPTQYIFINFDAMHSSEMANHLGHRTCFNDKDSMISAATASSGMPLNLLISDVGGLYSSASYLNNIGVVLWFKCMAFN